MVYFLIVGCLAYLAQAAAIDYRAQQPLTTKPQEQPHEVVQEHTQEPFYPTWDRRVFALVPDHTYNTDKYILPGIYRSYGHPSLGALQNISTYRSSDFPYSVSTWLHSGAPLEPHGSIVLAIQGAVSAARYADSAGYGVTWLDFDGQHADQIALSSVGVRKGGMVGQPARAAKIALDTPYVSVPAGVFAVVVQAAEAQWSREGELRVDCAKVDQLPDLVFGLEEQCGEAQEVVVTPRQYVLQEGEQCQLLVRSLAEDGFDAVLGWAAIRGRKFVIDWVFGKIGFGSHLNFWDLTEDFEGEVY